MSAPSGLKLTDAALTKPGDCRASGLKANTGPTKGMSGGRGLGRFGGAGGKGPFGPFAAFVNGTMFIVGGIMIQRPGVRIGWGIETGLEQGTPRAIMRLGR